MPPAKTRVVAQDDSSNSSKQAAQTAGPGRGNKRHFHGVVRQTSLLKDGNSAGDDSAAQAAQAANTGLPWTTESVTLLQDYRAAHKVDTPSAFKSQLNQCLLTNPGLGRQSPTMARKRALRKVAKEQLALAVRKNFNAAAVNEIDVMVDLLYKVRNQDKAFRMRSLPSKTK